MPATPAYTVVLGFTDNPATPADESSIVNYGPVRRRAQMDRIGVRGDIPCRWRSDTGDLSLRVDAYAQSKQFFSNVADTLNPDTVLPGYHLVNARVTWSGIMGSRVDASIFARNLFKEKYFTGGNAGQSGGLPNSVNPGYARFWGGEIRMGF